MDREAGAKPKVKFANRTRFLIMLLVTLCLSSVLSNTLTLNFTVICMADPKPEIHQFNVTGTVFQHENGTFYEIASEFGSMLEKYEEAIASRRYHYTPTEKSRMFSAIAVGAIISVYPSMVMLQAFGAYFVMLLFGFLSAAATAFIPLVAYLGVWYLLAFRVLQGTALGMTFSIIGNCTSNWSMQKQTTFYLAFVTCFFQIGPIFTMPVSAALCTSSFGWPAVYYVHSAITLVLFIAFAAFYKEFPDEHFCVSDKELDRINRGKGDMTAKKQKVPVTDVLKTNAVWAIWITALFNFMGIQLTMQFAPIYLNRVLGYPVAMTGALSSIPQIFTFFIKLLGGVLSDKLTFVEAITSVRLFNAVSIGGMGVFCIALAYTPATCPLLGLIFLIICTSIVGFNCGGFFRSSALMARQHHHFVMGGVSFLNCVAALASPVIVDIFVVDDTVDEWWYVWMVHGLGLILGNVYFCVFGKVEPAPWTQTAAPSKPAVVAPPSELFPNDIDCRNFRINSGIDFPRCKSSSDDMFKKTQFY